MKPRSKDSLVPKLSLGESHKTRDHKSRSWSFKTGVPKPELGNEEKRSR